jgi:hypothetical protein
VERLAKMCSTEISSAETTDHLCKQQKKATEKKQLEQAGKSGPDEMQAISPPKPTTSLR